MAIELTAQQKRKYVEVVWGRSVFWKPCPEADDLPWIMQVADADQMDKCQLCGAKLDAEGYPKIQQMLARRTDVPAETSCDNSSGKKVISVPSCVPAESTFTVDQFAAKEREIERLTAQVERLSAPVSDKDAMQLVNWAGLYGLAKVLNNWIAARAAEKGV